MQDVQVEPDQQHRADNRQEPARRMELALRRLPQDARDDTPDQRATDPQQRRHPESQIDGAGVEESREEADNEPDDDHPDDAHDAHVELLLVWLLWRFALSRPWRPD